MWLKTKFNTVKELPRSEFDKYAAIMDRFEDNTHRGDTSMGRGGLAGKHSERDVDDDDVQGDDSPAGAAKRCHATPPASSSQSSPTWTTTGPSSPPLTAGAQAFAQTLHKTPELSQRSKKGLRVGLLVTAWMTGPRCA